ncbi:MAG: heme-binding protein [Rhizobiaceae bacterium]|nr:heme-binding protein [Rhizobiaceae bacterium]
MFRDRPSAHERLSAALGDISERIAELEQRVVNRVHPHPSVAERARSAIRQSFGANNTSSWPDFMGGWAAPSVNDARRTIEGARGRLPDLRGALTSLGHRLPDARLPRSQSFKRGMEAQRGLDIVRDRPMTTLLVAGGALALVGAAILVTKKVAEHTEEPDFDTVRRDGDIEIRDYDAMIVAETVKSGYHEKARRAGFETLAAYIFGQGRSGKKISMTAPVLQQLSENEGRTKGWAIRFVMPKKFTLATLPAPTTDDVNLREMPAKRVVSIRFNGNFSASLASKKLMSLYNYVADENLKQKGDPEYAFYNAPWTPGFLKRNEILIEIER